MREQSRPGCSLDFLSSKVAYFSIKIQVSGSLSPHLADHCPCHRSWSCGTCIGGTCGTCGGSGSTDTLCSLKVLLSLTLLLLRSVSTVLTHTGFVCDVPSKRGHKVLENTVLFSPVLLVMEAKRMSVGQKVSLMKLCHCGALGLLKGPPQSLVHGCSWRHHLLCFFIIWLQPPPLPNGQHQPSSLHEIPPTSSPSFPYSFINKFLLRLSNVSHPKSTRKVTIVE